MGINKEVINRINQLLAEQNLTANALAYKSGISQSTIKSILNSESVNPGIVTIKKLCDGFEISIVDFFNTSNFSNLGQEMK